MKRKFIFYIIPLLIVAAAFITMKVLVGFRTTPPKRVRKPRPKIVETAVVKLQDVQSQIVAYGRLKSSQPVILNSEVAGTLMRGTVPFRPSQQFEKRALLLKIDDRQIRLEINRLKSDLLNSLASVLPEIRVDFPEEYKVWQNYFNSVNFNNNIPKLPQAANQKIKLFLSRFNVYKIFFSIKNSEILLEKHFFYAPFDGSIVSTDLRPGSNARIGTRLGEIINLEQLEMEIPVPAEDIQWIDPGKPVRLTSSEIAGEWTGTIKRIGKSIDTQTQTVQVYISINESRDTNLYDGLFLKAVIEGHIIHDAVSVLRKALYQDRFVYIIKDRKLDYREVAIARKETSSVIVNGGIQNGETLVLDVMQGVASGMPARSKSDKAIPSEEEDTGGYGPGRPGGRGGMRGGGSR